MKNSKKQIISDIENTPFGLVPSITLAGAAMGAVATNAIIDNMEAQGYGILPKASWREPMYPWDKKGMMKTRDRNGCYKY